MNLACSAIHHSAVEAQGSVQVEVEVEFSFPLTVAPLWLTDDYSPYDAEEFGLLGITPLSAFRVGTPYER